MVEKTLSSQYLEKTSLFEYYSRFAKEANEEIVMPFCENSRFFLPLLDQGFPLIGSCQNANRMIVEDLVEPAQIFSHLNPGGKALIEIKTKGSEPQETWKKLEELPLDGIKIVCNLLTRYNKDWERSLFIYELWKEESLLQSEVEGYKRKLYKPEEAERLFQENELRVSRKWQIGQDGKEATGDNTYWIIYECIKEQK